MNIVANKTERLRSKLYLLLVITISNAIAIDNANDKPQEMIEVVPKKSVGKELSFPTMSKVT